MRSKAIDFWKFAAAIAVMLTHSHTFFGRGVVAPLGHVANEFFFMVTGFFLASSVFRDDRPFALETIGAETGAFLWRKITRFYLCFALAFLMTFVALQMVFDWNEAWHDSVTAIPQLLLLRSTGLPVGRVIGGDWYLSSMIISLALLYPLFRLNRSFFSDWVAPLLGVFGLAYMYVNYGGLSAGTGEHVAGNNVRAIGDICLGVAAYRCAWRFRQRGLCAGWPAAVCGALAAVVGMTLVIFIKDNTEAVAAVICFFVFIVAEGATGEIVRSRAVAVVCRHLGQLSLYVYLTHSAVRYWMVFAAKRTPWLMDMFKGEGRSIACVLLIYFAASFALAEVTLLLCNWIRSGVKETA